MYPLTGTIYIKIQGSLIQEYHDEIIVEVFKRKHLKAYGKEYWSLSALSGYDRIIREDHQDYLFVKRENILRQTKRLQEETRNKTFTYF